MFRSILTLATSALALAACSPASASAADPNNDVHCFALAEGFQGLARNINAPAHQQRAVAAIAAWYGPRFDAAVQARGRDTILAEGAALARFVDRNPEAARAALTACTERAVAEPAFNDFAARWARRR
jgi:hypothetical protein